MVGLIEGPPAVGLGMSVGEDPGETSSLAPLAKVKHVKRESKGKRASNVQRVPRRTRSQSTFFDLQRTQRPGVELL